MFSKSYLLNNLTKKELAKLCEKSGLPKYGLKEEQVERLAKFVKSSKKDKFEKEAEQLSVAVDVTVSYENPVIYCFYVGEGIIKIGFTEHFSSRILCHQKDSEFSCCILIGLWKIRIKKS